MRPNIVASNPLRYPTFTIVYDMHRGSLNLLPLETRRIGMDGIHDMGGAQGSGAVQIEPDEPTFVERWHGRAFALVPRALGLR
jgi:hypothetical protein